MLSLVRHAWLLVLAFGLLACGPASTPRRFEGAGDVRNVDRVHGQLLIAHDEIAGFMPAMTMNLDVVPATLLDDVDPGARVAFVLEQTEQSVRITAIEVLAAGDPTAAEGLPAPAEREPAPDFELIDHDGRDFALRDYRGKAVLLDFIFTRCTGPCPILTASHASLQKRLPAELVERVRFVSISIDPIYDTPKRLRSYAETRGAELDRWRFLTGPPERVNAVLADYFIGTGKEPSGTLVHVVATYLIDPEGNIQRRYLGLDHPSDEKLDDLVRVLAAS